MLAPIYKRLGGDEGRREAQEEGLYKPRQAAALDMLLGLDLDVFCLQEVWLESPVLRRLYREKLAGYRLLETPRTSGRGDGLLTAVRERNLAVVDKRDIIFNDCGDRVAQLVRLRRKGGGSGDGGEFLLVSTHLLFPHNRNSSLIRLRETYKVSARGSARDFRRCDGFLPKLNFGLGTGDFVWGKFRRTGGSEERD